MMLSTTIAAAMLLRGALLSDAPHFVESSTALGLDVASTGRVCVADLNGDDRPDVIASRAKVFLNQRDVSSPLAFRFQSIDARLLPPGDDGVSIFVDMDGDRVPDAVSFRSLDIKKVKERADKNDTSPHAWWQRGRGDGTFDPPITIDATTPKTACAIAAGDVDRDGRTDLLIGNWYSRYGESNEAYTADLLLNKRGDDGAPRFERSRLPEDSAIFEDDHDIAGRPIYGALITELLPREVSVPPQLVELAYGRRWNRFYARGLDGVWSDVAPELGFDGDADRSSPYPVIPGSTTVRTNEKPFRSNGNTFDAAVGDVNNDGRFDLFIAEITHFWAGASSDRSRFLIAESTSGAQRTRFTSPASYCVDRFDASAGLENRWNQGDLFAELVDTDHDGRLDLFLASGDYPDPPPFDERLRLFHQRSAPSDDGRLFVDATLAAGIDHVGCGQIALADFDCDGRMDIVAGQSFNRFTPEMIAAAGGAPKVRLWLNRTGGATGPPSIELLLRGDPAHGIAAQPFGAIVHVKDGDRTLIRQLMGPGGHAGKESEAIVHAPVVGGAKCRVDITWPCTPPRTTSHELAPGRHVIDARERSP
ncbi:MAG: VCBS repeat-containing protein [Phycisphaerae bacterium]|nr:VCBS repeat-containing protein [Phycisphaerae bacterium]